ncbi:MAG: imidazoleglycerol-phosphate dehydratase HisB [Eubacteriales bacterium]
MRESTVNRKTAETDISLRLNLDGSGEYKIDTGVGFFNHMLELFTRHGDFDLTLSCKGDTWVDAHHTVEDVGICLGKAFSEALGDKKGINRYGFFVLPMDESLILTAVDFSGRSYLGYDLNLTRDKVGDFDTELVEEFLLAFTREAGINLHIRQLAGSNTHHIIEGGFKCLARSLKMAVSIDEKNSDKIPSTKGIL